MGELFRRMPILWLLLPLAAYIIIGRYYPLPFLTVPVSFTSHSDSARWYRVAVDDYSIERRKTYRYTVSVLPKRERAYLYLRKDSSITFPFRGDTLWVNTVWQQKGRQTIASGYANSRHWAYSARCNKPIRDAKALQHRLLERYEEVGLLGDELGTVAAMTLGYKDEMDKEVRQHFQRAGASHVLAVSGLHTGIVYAVVVFILSLFGRYRPLYDERWQQLCLSAAVMTAMTGYAALTGWSDSVTRSVVMLGLVELAHVMHRVPYSFNTLAAAMFLILCFQPSALFSVSFQLSCSAVAGILLLEPPLRRLLPLPQAGLGYIVLRYVRGLITVSIAAAIATTPISVYYFHTYSRYFLLTNIFVIPMTFIIVAGAVVLLTIGWLPYVGEVIGKGLSMLAGCMNSLTGKIEHLPYAVGEAAPLWWQVGLLYAVIISAATLLIRITR